MDSNHTCLAVINLDSALKKYENYYPQVFLKECNYIKKKVIRHFIDDLESISDDSDNRLKLLSYCFFKNVLFEKVIFQKNQFMREQFGKSHFLRRKFQKCLF